MMNSSSTKPAQLDPLYTIFEQHLMSFQDSDTDRKTFIGHVIKDYLTYLRKMNIVIPIAMEQAVIEELATQVNTMLVKKIYGCLSIDEFQKKAPTRNKRRARGNYARLQKAARGARKALG